MVGHEDTAAAVLAWMSGLGFGIPGIYAIWYLIDRGFIASLMGYPTYGGCVREARRDHVGAHAGRIYCGLCR